MSAVGATPPLGRDHAPPIWRGRPHLEDAEKLDTDDIIEAEANSSATAGLALFSGCNISKSSIAGSALLRSYSRTAERFGLYIRPRKPFAISTYLYIQNCNPFVMSKTLYIPLEAHSAPHNRALTPFPIVYTCLEVLCHQPIFVYTEPQPICYQRNTDLDHTRGLHRFEPLERTSKSAPDEAAPKPAAGHQKVKLGVSRYHRYHPGENILWH